MPKYKLNFVPNDGKNISGSVNNPARHEHNQSCSKCHLPLYCYENCSSGSNIYWGLFCSECGNRYEYDTYSKDLRDWPIRDGSGESIEKIDD